tara:strand:+ start:278 stop:538 length:261 start_codon:yes stop_codon:yes gene_type:complete
VPTFFIVIDELGVIKHATIKNTDEEKSPGIFKTWIDNNTPANFTFHNNRCYCKCRHIARYICRQTEEYPGIGRPLKNPPTPKSVIR